MSPLNGDLLDRMRQRIRDLDPQQYPADPSKVVVYLRRVQSFGFWANTQLLSFVKTCDLLALQSQFDGVNPKLPCSAALDRIAKAKSGPEPEAYGWVRSDWARCVWEAEMKQVGNYPKDLWNCFLAARGIQEHFVKDEGFD